MSLLDDKASNNSKLLIYTDFTTFQPLMDIKLLKNCKFASI